MEVLKDISSTGLDVLRDAFVLHEDEGGLTEDAFLEVLSRVCPRDKISTLHEDGYIRKLFAALDVVGSGRISWDSFTMHAVESVKEGGLDELTRPRQDAHLSFRPYHVEQLVATPPTYQWTEMRVLHRIGRVMRVMTDSGGLSSMDLCQMEQRLPTCGVIRSARGPLLAWDLVSSRVRAPHTNSILCSYTGGHVCAFRIDKTHRCHHLLQEYHHMRLAESQTSMRWIEPLDRLALGGRSGVVMLWNLQEHVMTSRKRLFHDAVTAICSRGHLLHATSLDTNHSVKCLDLETNNVRFALGDHRIGGALVLEIDEEFLFSTGFESHIVQRPLVAPTSSPTLLHDIMAPHMGRINSLCRFSGTPFLASGDVHGMLKFWDLRMGSCLQTLRLQSSFLNDCSSRPKLSEKDDVARHMKTPVKSIIHLDLLGKVLVATSKEIAVLSADIFICPDLVDDRYRCRFLFLLNSDMLVTVHDRYVKLWNSFTGILMRCSGPELTESDITCCCMVEPLNRQLLLCTAKGEVKGLSVPLLQPTVDLTPILRRNIRTEEITSLHIVAKFRDAKIPHVFVTTKSSVLLVPFGNTDDCSRPHAVVRFDTLLRGILQEDLVIDTLAVAYDQLLIATSDGRVHVFQCTHEVTHSHTFNFSAQVDLMVVSQAVTPAHTCNAMGSECIAASDYIAFLADTRGRVYIAALRRRVVDGDGDGWSSVSRDTRPISGAERGSCELLGRWVPHEPGSWITPKKKPRRGNGPRRTHTRGWTSAEARKKWEPFPQKGDREAGNALGHFSLDAINTNAIFLFFLERYNVVVTADEVGMVRLWDVASAIARCAGENLSNIAPVKISAWRMPERDIVCLQAVDHPRLHLPLLAAATGTLRVSLWSMDGVMLGTLASGREVDVSSGGRRFGLEPYILMLESTTAALWGNFVAHVTHAKFCEAQPVCASVRRHRPLVSHVHSELKRISKHHRQRSRCTLSTIGCSGSPAMANTTPKNAPSCFLPPPSMQSTPTVEPVSSASLRLVHYNGDGEEERDDNDNDDNEEEEEEEEEEKCDGGVEPYGARGRGAAGAGGRRIVNTKHKHHVTRSAAVAPLRQPGFVRLPKLTKSTVKRNLC